MDKKTVIGFILIGVVFVVFSYLSRPSEEDIKAYQRQQDSIAAIKEQEQQLLAEQKADESFEAYRDSIMISQNDSLRQKALLNKYGEFAPAVDGEEEFFVIENDSIKLTISSKGAQITSALLKTYNRYDGDPIELVKNGNATFNYRMITASNRIVETRNLYFSGKQLSPEKVSFTLPTALGSSLEMVYTLTDKYMVDIDYIYHDLNDVLAVSSPYMDAVWNIPIYQNEKSLKSEQRYSGLAYKASGENVEKIKANKSKEKDLAGKISWVAFRDMFFSTVVYSPEMLQQVSLRSEIADGTDRVKDLSSAFSIPVSDKPYKLVLYIGPHDYKLLKQVDKELGGDSDIAKIVDMGDWFRFINVWLIIPVFNFLETITSNYGLIILLLTLFIKLLLSPFTYKSFLSQAKMRVLKPQVDAINAKYPGDDNMMKRQQETMNLYKSAGANTLGGCLPMLLQMPFLIAMYQYFPTSLNLRGESFLWAQDLSTFDDVIRWSGNIPIISSLFGNHISLFCLLMTITQIVYMRINQASTGQTAMPGMKMLPYFTSIMLFVFLNQNASGLSYYYLLSMLITIIQTYIFRYAINEDKLLAKMEANKKKPIKKSKWVKKMEELQKQQAELQKQQRR